MRKGNKMYHTGVRTRDLQLYRHRLSPQGRIARTIQSNLSYPDSCYLGTSLNRAADLPYFMLTLQKLWAVQWVWPIIAYVFILYSEIQTNLSYGHPLIPRRPDKRGLTVYPSQISILMT